MSPDAIVLLFGLGFNAFGIFGIWHRLGRVEAKTDALTARVLHLEGNKHVGKVSNTSA